MLFKRSGTIDLSASSPILTLDCMAMVVREKGETLYLNAAAQDF